MQLHLLDWIIVAFILLICFGPALFFRKRSGKNTSEFFASGRAVPGGWPACPWWPPRSAATRPIWSPISSAATGSPELGLVGLHPDRRRHGLLLRPDVAPFRSPDDLEFYEIRYSGKAASVVRGFRSVYLGFIFNCIIMATVNLAACKIAAVLFGFERCRRSFSSACSTSSSPRSPAFGASSSST